VPAPFALNALGFAAAAFLIWRLRIPPRAPVQRRPVRTEMNEGWDWMRAHPTILRLAVMLGILNAVVIMALTMLVLFSQEVLSLGAAGYGLLMTASAAGGVVGGILGPRVVVRLGARGAVRLALGLFPLPFIAIALTSSVWIVAAALFTEMFAGLLWNIVTVSYRQRRIPDTLLGRVNSLYRFFGWGMMPLGALAGGWIVSLAEPQLGRALALRLPYAGAALGCGALAGYGWIRLRLPP
jgi:predicted MFS family arabinose efflux permease